MLLEIGQVHANHALEKLNQSDHKVSRTWTNIAGNDFQAVLCTLNVSERPQDHLVVHIPGTLRFQGSRT
jgi:hypothetical protein